MVVTYLLILTGMVGYACWRGYQLEVWASELSESVDQLSRDLATHKTDNRGEFFDTEDAIFEAMCKIGKLENAAKKSRGKK